MHVCMNVCTCELDILWHVEEPEEGAPPPPVQLYSPEILTFVAMPADMIEAAAADTAAQQP